METKAGSDRERRQIQASRARLLLASGQSKEARELIQGLTPSLE